VLVSVLTATTLPADAACKKFAFLVNDYGKEGPSKDAQNLLDKNIAEWAAANGVKEYQTGKKTVSCELFLDFVVFDEHTCTAQANVCWGPGVKANNKGGGEQAQTTTEESTGEHPPAPMRKAEALGIAPQQAAAAAPANEIAAPAGAAPTSPVEQIAAPADTPAATPAVNTPAQAVQATTPPTTTIPSSASLETGALQPEKAIEATPAPAEKRTAGISDKERAAAATAAASAAAAAERAAVAAETAANAAKEAAAAAVAASAASKGSVVPPLDHASGAKPTHTE
jgi:hypothetical protein